jgi:hypothetical protein
VDLNRWRSLYRLIATCITNVTKIEHVLYGPDILDWIQVCAVYCQLDIIFLSDVRFHHSLTFNDYSYFCSVGDTFTIMLVHVTVKLKYDS